MVYLIVSFEYSWALELAISDLIQYGIHKDNIKAIPLIRKNACQDRSIQTLMNTSKFSGFDLFLLFGNIFSVAFCCFGFIWKWGPIIWGLIGFFSGGLLGTIISVIKNIRYKSQSNQKNPTEVFVMIQCPEEAKKVVQETLWNHQAIGMAEIE